MDDPSELSDAEFMKWAGLNARRWAFLSIDKCESWLEHLLARIESTSDPDEGDSLWRLACVIAQAERLIEGLDVRPVLNVRAPLRHVAA